MAEIVVTPDMVKAAAAAILNARGMRRGVPPIDNVIEMFDSYPAGRAILVEAMEDAGAAITAFVEELNRTTAEAAEKKKATPPA